MVVALAVVVRPPILQRLGYVLRGYGRPSSRSGDVGGDFQGSQRGAPVTGRPFEKRARGAFVHRQVAGTEPALPVRKRALNDSRQRGVIQLLQADDAGTAQKRRNNLERGVLGGGADERDRAVLDVRQDHVLLRFVEAVNLVDEEHGPESANAACLRFRHDLPQVRDAGGNG